MQWHLILPGLLVCSITSFAQVGIGTTSPNSKSLLDLTSTTTGLLIPRMTQAERLTLTPTLTANEAGLLVYQTTNQIGLFSFDGAVWKQYALGPILGTDGATLWWSNTTGWNASNTLYNGGGSIGIGATTSLTEKLTIHSASNSRIRFTNTATGTGAHGLLIGVLSVSGDAQLLQIETKPLTFGTSNIERMRIDAAGNVGINRMNPTAALDVNGTAKIGANGSELTGIIRTSSMIDIPNIAGNSEGMDTIAIPNVVVGATVNVSASTPVPHVMVGNARVVSNGNVEIQFMNMSSMATDPAALMFYITVIQ